MNNYERIKNMSIDEMAEWFADVGDEICINCTVEEMRQWLLQEEV